MKRFLSILIMLLAGKSLSAQTAAYTLPDLFKPRIVFGWDAGVDISTEKSYRLGYSVVFEQRSCALGPVCIGTSAGLSITPETGTRGVYLQRWMVAGLVGMGLKTGYEAGPRYDWMFFEPQVGLGFQRFRLTYGYHAPIFFSGKTSVGRHVLGVAYTFGMAYAN